MFVDAFLANYAVHADFAKASKFMALIYQPPGVVAGGLLGGLIGRATTAFGLQIPEKATTFLKGINTASLSFQCESAVLPGYQINTVEQKIYGAPWVVAATPVYEPLQLTFICAGDMWERKFFDAWMDFILPKGSSSMQIKDVPIPADLTSTNNALPQAVAKYRDEYVSNIQIIQFSEVGIPSMRITFEEAFPIQLSPQPVSWGTDDIHRLNVTFHYRAWRKEDNLLSKIYDQFRSNATVEVGPLELVR